VYKQIVGKSAQRKSSCRRGFFADRVKAGRRVCLGSNMPMPRIAKAEASLRASIPPSHPRSEGETSSRRSARRDPPRWKADQLVLIHWFYQRPCAERRAQDLVRPVFSQWVRRHLRSWVSPRRLDANE